MGIRFYKLHFSDRGTRTWGYDEATEQWPERITGSTPRHPASGEKTPSGAFAYGKNVHARLCDGVDSIRSTSKPTPTDQRTAESPIAWIRSFAYRE